MEMSTSMNPLSKAGSGSPVGSDGQSSAEEGQLGVEVKFKHEWPRLGDGGGVSSVVSCFINLSNTILGSGMLGLPYAFANTGHVLGAMLMILAAGSSVLALHLLSEAALSQDIPSSFYSVAKTAMPQLTVVIDFAVAIKCFGVATSYLIVVGDVMPQVIQYAQDSVTNTGWQRREVWITLGWCLVAPLCFMKNLDSLKYTSTAAVFFVFFLAILIILYSFNSRDDHILNPCADILPGQVVRIVSVCLLVCE